MIHVLLVDDEILALNGLESMIDWEKHDIARPLLATSMKQAVSVIKQHEVDILICDIQMPNGTGLELLRWIGGHAPDIVTVFLTFHAKFEYVKEAMSLGAFDYLLKPASPETLESTLEHCVGKVNDKRLAQKKAQALRDNQAMLREAFWREIVQEVDGLQNHKILERFERKGFIPDRKALYTPVLIRIEDFTGLLKSWSRYDLNYAIQNILSEIFYPAEREPDILSVQPGHYFILLAHGQDTPDRPETIRRCTVFADAFRTYLGKDIAFSVGAPFPIDRAVAGVREVHLTPEGKNTRLNPSDTPRPVPWDREKISTLLQEGRRDELLYEIDTNLSRLHRQNGAAPAALEACCQDFMQMLNLLLIQNNILAHTLFTEESLLALHAKAAYSLQDARNFLVRVSEQTCDVLRASGQSQSIVRKVMDYVDRNLGKELSRKDICDHVYIHQDYLSTVFRRETGVTISEYIFEKRMALAKELLKNTDEPIGTVCERVGYAYNSHFSKMFKMKTGVSPQQYRAGFR